MTIAYDRYLRTHIDSVNHGLMWILDRFSKEDLDNIFPKINTTELLKNVQIHDASKYLPEEYYAYDDYFYGKTKTEEIENAFDYAWLHHIHNNPHHWQYWLLKEDDSPVSGNNMTVKALEIPDNYILEMVADWWSFSWKNYITSHDRNDLYDIFTWYEEHTDSIIMHPASKQKVEQLLDLIRNALDSSTTVIELV